jgi:hypothetical protein
MTPRALSILAARVAACYVAASISVMAQSVLPPAPSEPHGPPLPQSEREASREAMINTDVIAMVNAEFSPATIRAAIEANDSAFDISPQALLTLKNAGVPETVMEMMLAAAVKQKEQASAERSAAEPAQLEEAIDDSAPPDPPIAAQATDTEQAVAVGRPAADTVAALAAPVVLVADEATAMIEATRLEQPQDQGQGQGPHAWVSSGAARTKLRSSIAQVAFTDAKRFRPSTLETLHSIGSKALAFASPALGVASELGGLFRLGDPTLTAVWALPGTQSSVAVEPRATFEVEFGGIPGLDPEEYQPAVVEVVTTSDNFRLVGAVRSKQSSLEAGIPTGDIIEERIPVKKTRVGRGRYHLTLEDSVAPGEYAIVLRPIEPQQKKRSEARLGDLMGEKASEILYTTWDFSLRTSA